jgi:hypothetical protein
MQHQDGHRDAARGHVLGEADRAGGVVGDGERRHALDLGGRRAAGSLRQAAGDEAGDDVHLYGTSNTVDATLEGSVAATVIQT